MAVRPRAQRSEILEEMAKVSRKIRTVFDARVREKGLTLARARTLLRIARCEAANQKELADELEIETATLVRLIDGLEAQGLIARREVEGDRRAKQVVLTRAGEALAELVDDMVAEIGREVLSGIDEREVAAALTIIRKMAGNLEAIALEPAE
ncbi:MarR family transcriptional regulator [Mesorhizobium sp. BAC0120]|uniref:MarR family winged helix-turn-helix transcriptional regulator n=1 Tax=Mesorhizobium sp. BAC0120 TaxID=3090670 RepID=UPI00298C0947|nr:MarR family transcriptional regulator [Mesorhizobium sp. BAC0120]MDW6020485.1 MarR family transcriptional regulator [Mesorhizobium sp. BAC0120]